MLVYQRVVACQLSATCPEPRPSEWLWCETWCSQEQNGCWALGQIWGVTFSSNKKQVTVVVISIIYIIFLWYRSMIWLCFILTRAVFSKGRKFDLCESYPRIIPPNHTPNHTPESYPRIIPRIIPPNHTPESYPKKSRLWMFLLGSFGIALASLVIMDLTS